ncbi:MAG: phosphatase [Ferruginibacter sp.]|nr:phosphatase [Cytophagales bacterium]
MGDIEFLFEAIGGQFLTPAPVIAEKLTDIRAFLFDWDGVFNGGTKGEGLTSRYSEPDSMGTNLLRFGGWQRHGTLPVVGILTALDNPTAVQLARREHFPVVYFGFKHKEEAFLHFLETYHLQPSQVAFVFDDVIDLSVARQCGLRFFVSRPASPLLRRFVTERQLADYGSGNSGGSHAVREICELILGLQGRYEATLEARIAFHGPYTRYLTERNQTTLHCYTPLNGRIGLVMP